ncbi:MAG: hypothetical protein CML02_02510 [Pseudooceanicola sp.]|nr:hypothetical protein [Pseudooceanicola sp.]
MVTLTPIDVFRGNPPSNSHQPKPTEIVELLDGIVAKQSPVIIQVEDYYDRTSTADSSSGFQAAADAALALVSDTQGVTLKLSSPIYIANQVVIGTGNPEFLHIDFSEGSINVISGGDLDGSTPAIKVNSQDSTLIGCKIYCDKICSGWWFRSCARSRAVMPFADRFLTYGIRCDGNSMGGFVLQDAGGNEWQPADPEFGTESNFEGDTLIVDCADMVIDGGEIGWAARNIYLGTSASNCRFYGVHPFNGNPSAPPARVEPKNVVSDAPSRCFFFDPYFDNGYVIDNTSRLVIYGGRHLELQDRVTLTEPLIRVKLQEDEAGDRFSIFDNDSSVGFFSTTWDALDADYEWHHTNITDSIGPGRFTRAFRVLTSIYTDDDNAFPDEQFLKRGGSTNRIVWKFVPKANDDGAAPLLMRVANNTFDFAVHGGGAPEIKLDNAALWTSGAGSPEGAVSAPVGSIYSRTDGGAGTSFYVKESGGGNTGWVGK